MVHTYITTTDVYTRTYIIRSLWATEGNELKSIKLRFIAIQIVSMFEFNRRHSQLPLCTHEYSPLHRSSKQQCAVMMILVTLAVVLEGSSHNPPPLFLCHQAQSTHGFKYSSLYGN